MGSCKDNCPMTKQMRESKYCTGNFDFDDGTITYGCTLINKSIKDSNFLKCNYWSLGIKKVCSSCTLQCDNNKNKDLKEIIKNEERLRLLTSDLNPMASIINPNAILSASKIIRKNKNDFKETEKIIGLAESARNLLASALNGKMIDPVYFKAYAEKLSKDNNIKIDLDSKMEKAKLRINNLLKKK